MPGSGPSLSSFSSPLQQVIERGETRMRRNSSESKQRRLRQTLLGAVAIPRLWIGVFLVGCLLTRWSGSWGSAFSAFGPEDFLRSTGAPVQEVRTFTVSNP